ncbi:MAG: cobalt-precorrin 5A hydrolase [Bacillota bacterium]
MSYGIVTLTKGALGLGSKLLDFYGDAVLYIHEKFDSEDERVKKINQPFQNFIGEIFDCHKYLVFIMATGIVVRSIAPYLKDKKTDPGIIVLDEKGKNVISLLSGHMGGANELAVRTADYLGSNPVITTASDVNMTMAVDTLASMLHCQIENYPEATKVSAHIVNGEMVGIISSKPVNIDLPYNIIPIREEARNTMNIKGLIKVTSEKRMALEKQDTVLLRPREIVIGLGCKKGKTKEEILWAIQDTLSKLNLSEKAVKHIATIDVKKEEIGIQQAAKELGVPVIIVDTDEIKKIEEKFETSEFVRRTVGVGAVCEPAALLSSKQGVVIQSKQSYHGITIAVVREGE